ncbi:glucoside xylosyltransferase 1-like isoform X3 [Polyodon spathula]|uniref:glucoside xylosyltransferase 1-like isoform X3 n=1 Tax=Polyodon spathula TaxID=7913 RepID=UPI001B7ED95F|nr:glucoside xylosyltransferase 1-like isoform X3 [Polyodon spathula]XP_041110389.1 glucoside xylosyltransferase 1-like isoform X3 [Polyodon spathula]XP_041110390.1 glucoside xylosyltransferase 1-like isoform X3 [Polyodon spathula]
MRRYLRVLLGCILFGFCSILYVFSQLAASLEAHDGWMGRKPQQRTAVLRGESRHGAGKGAGKTGLENQYWYNRYIMRKADASDPSNTPVETMHLAVVACGERLEETVTMLKSILLFNVKPIQFHIFAEDNLHIKFKDILDSWLESYRLKFSYTVHSITFPSGNAAEWKRLFKPCASQRLFLPIILKDVDSLLYVDTDILFLQPVDEMWSFFRELNSTQIAAMAPEHEEPSIGWYNRFARHPFYGKTGINSGVMLMNMTRIRKKYFKKAFLYSPAIGIIALITVFMAVTANLLKKEASSFFMETGEFIMIISNLLLKRSTKQYNNTHLEMTQSILSYTHLNKICRRQHILTVEKYNTYLQSNYKRV